MENYYSDRRVLYALEKSYEGGLMDILTFVKEIDFEIKSNLGFDVLWDSLNRKRCTNVGTSLLKWMGYEGSPRKQRQTFIQLLESNEIEYEEIDHKDVLIEHFPEIQEEIDQMRSVDKPRKRWLIMDSDNFKEAIMSLTTKRSKEIRKYYLQLEKLVQLYGAYTHQFKENQLKVQLQEKEDHILLLKDLLIDDQKREKTQVIYIATSCNYARQNRFKPGGVESADKLASRFSTYNSRSAAGDEWYYSDTFLVADYRQIENRLKDLLGRFRDKKGKEIYIMHYTNIRYIVEYLCTHYNDEVDEVNTKLDEFISNLNCHCLRPVVPPPSQVTYANITTLKEDGTTTNTTLSANSRQDFIDQLKEYVSGLDSGTTEITKKKVFDDLKVKKDRKNKFPLLCAILSELRPDILLKQKEA
jgi:MSV199 domain